MAKIYGTSGARSDLVENVESLQYVAIQIKSHQVTTSYFKPEFRRGFGWRRNEIGTDKNKKEKVVDKDIFCVCEKCGHRELHIKGIPCKNVSCPKCGKELTKKEC